MLVAERVASFLLKYSPDQPRDDHGRFTAGVSDESQLYTGVGTAHEAAHSWGNWSFMMRRALASPSTSLADTQFRAHGPSVEQQAKVLLDAANGAPPTDSKLYRGLYMRSDADYARFMSTFAKGSRVDMNLSSWTQSRKIAGDFAMNSYGTASREGGDSVHQIVLSCAPGAHAFDGTNDIPQGTQFTEHMMAGRFEVTGLSHYDQGIPGGNTVTLDVVGVRQAGTLDAAQLVGTKVARAEGPAHLLDWLEPYLDQRMVPPTAAKADSRLHFESGGQRRDDHLEPIKARTKAAMLRLAAELTGREARKSAVLSVLLKTDFYTDETGVHPVRGSEGYEPEKAGEKEPAPAAPAGYRYTKGENGEGIVRNFNSQAPHPVADTSLIHCSPALLGPAMEQLSRLQEQYPNITGPWYVARGDDRYDNVIASTTRPHSSDASIDLTNNYWKSGHESWGSRSGWVTVKGPEGVMAHEWAHSIRVPGLTRLTADFRNPSGYGKTGPEEKYAEWVAAAVVPGGRLYDSPQAQQIRGMLAATNKLEKFSPDQPRDERGRWTAGDGGELIGRAYDPNSGRGKWAPSSMQPKWATIDEAVKDLSERYPYTRFSPTLLKGDPTRVMAALAAFDTMQTRFPGVDHIQTITMVRDNKSLAGTIAYTDGKPWGVKIALNDAYFGQNPPMDPWGRSAPAGRWFVEGTSNPQGTMVHEFGHAMFWETIHDSLNPDGTVNATPAMTSVQRALNSQDLYSWAKLSLYSLDSSPERWAESFAAAFNPDSSVAAASHPAAVAMRQYVADSPNLTTATTDEERWAEINAAMGYTPKVASADFWAWKYSEDQPRDEHGRWTAGASGEPELSLRPPAGAWYEQRKAEWDRIPPEWQKLSPSAFRAAFTERTGIPLLGVPSERVALNDTKAALATLADLHEKYPQVPIAGIGSGSVAMLGPNAIAGTYGEAVRDTPLGIAHDPTATANGASSIYLSYQYWTGRQPGLYAQDTGFHPAGCSNPSGYITHEFGHAVANYATYTIASQGISTLGWSAPPVSVYGRQGGISENFAEVFAAGNAPGAGYVPGSTIDRAVQSQNAWLAGLGIGKASVPGLTKFSPDQPRDDHGRWTSGGSDADLTDQMVAGSKPGAVPGDLSYGGRYPYPKAMADFTAAHPGTKLSGMAANRVDWLNSRDALVAIDREMNRFPGVPLKEVTLGVPVGADKAGIAWTHNYGDGTSRISLNPRFFGSSDYFGDGGHATETPDNNFHPPGTSNTDGYVTHEFGHAVWNAAGAAGQAEFRDFMGSHWTPSIYAMQNEREKFAEFYSGAYSPRSTVLAEPASAEFRGMVESVLAAPTKIAKFNPDQPRDERGRWSAGATAGMTEIPAPIPSLEQRLWGRRVIPEEWADKSMKDVAAEVLAKTGTRVYYNQLGRNPEAILDGKAALATYMRLHEAFPGVKVDSIAWRSDLRYVETSSGGGHLWGRANNFDSNSGPRSIEMNSATWNGKDNWAYGRDTTPAFHPRGTNDPGGIMTHEFGHMVQGTYMAAAPFRGGSGGRLYDAYTHFGSDQYDPQYGGRAASVYGRTSGVENFAEMFAATYAPNSESAGYDNLSSFLERSGLTTAGSAVEVRKMLTKTDFYTEDGVVHPIRGSEGYDPGAAGEFRTMEQVQEWARNRQPAEPKQPKSPMVGTEPRMTQSERRTAVAAIKRGLETFRSTGGQLVERPGTGELDAAFRELGDKIDNGQSGPNGFGTSFAQSATQGRYVNLVYDATGEVAGAHGFTHASASDTRRWGGATALGHGIFGTTGDQPGAGSAMAAAYIKQAAAANASIAISPVSTAQGFWSKMGMRPTGDYGYGWGMTAADVKAIAKQLPDLSSLAA